MITARQVVMEVSTVVLLTVTVYGEEVWVSTEGECKTNDSVCMMVISMLMY